MSLAALPTMMLSLYRPIRAGTLIHFVALQNQSGLAGERTVVYLMVWRLGDGRDDRPQFPLFVGGLIAPET